MFCVLNILDLDLLLLLQSGGARGGSRKWCFVIETRPICSSYKEKQKHGGRAVRGERYPGGLVWMRLG